LGKDVFLSRDFGYEPHVAGDIRYEIGDHVSLRGCHLLSRGKGRIRIGECSVLNVGCRVESHELIEIGSHVQIAHGVTILDTNSHDLDPLRRRAALRRSRGLSAEILPETVERAPVRIGDDVWIGMHAMVMKGVTVGDGAVVAAGAVVTRDVAPRTVVAGNPARGVKALG
jgi:acetyltransferase-like isoleucine patch superfamily enzyme